MLRTKKVWYRESAGEEKKNKAKSRANKQKDEREGQEARRERAAMHVRPARMRQYRKLTELARDNDGKEDALMRGPRAPNPRTTHGSPL